MACVDVMTSGPNQLWFFAPHILMIYVNSFEESESWKKSAEELHMVAAIAKTGKLPADILKCDVLIVPLTVEPLVTQTRDATVNTLA